MPFKLLSAKDKAETEKLTPSQIEALAQAIYGDNQKDPTDGREGIHWDDLSQENRLDYIKLAKRYIDDTQCLNLVCSAQALTYEVVGQLSENEISIIAEREYTRQASRSETYVIYASNIVPALTRAGIGVYRKPIPKSHYRKKYDVFISYRRVGGWETAQMLQTQLTAMGYKVFFDLESMKTGDFNEQLLTVIKNCTDFVLVLAAEPNSLERCNNEGDWLRREIEHAFDCGKNVIPIRLRNYEDPPILPGSLERLRSMHGQNGLGMQAGSEIFSESVRTLTRKYLHSTRKVVAKRVARIALASIVLAYLLVASSLNLFQRFQPAAPNEGTLEAITAVFAEHSYVVKRITNKNTIDAYRDHYGGGDRFATITSKGTGEVGAALIEFASDSDYQTSCDNNNYTNSLPRSGMVLLDAALQEPEISAIFTDIPDSRADFDGLLKYFKALGYTVAVEGEGFNKRSTIALVGGGDMVGTITKVGETVPSAFVVQFATDEACANAYKKFSIQDTYRRKGAILFGWFESEPEFVRYFDEWNAS